MTEGFELSKDLFSNGLWNSLRRSAVQEFPSERLDLLAGALVAQRAPQELAFAGRESGHVARKLEHLFLKQNHAQGFLQSGLCRRMQILDSFRAFATQPCHAKEKGRRVSALQPRSSVSVVS